MIAAGTYFLNWILNQKPPFLFGLVCLLGAALLQTGCNGYTSRQVLDPAAAVTRLQGGEKIKAEVDRLARPLIASREDHDLAVGVLTPDGVVHYFGYSVSRPPGPDTIFQIGSVTKVFVASLLVILVQEGELNYDDTVRSILPSSVKVSPGVGAVTLRELVTHTSGLPREPHTIRQLYHVVNFVFGGENPYDFITKDYLYKYISTYRVEPKAERGYCYSNLGYGLLAKLIEVKTGRSLPDLIEEKICRPLGLRDTGFTLTPEQRKRLEQGHAGDEPRFFPRNHPMPDWDMGEIMRASGGMYSTVNDLMTFAKSNLGMLGNSLDPVFARTRQVAIRTPDEDITLGCWMIDHYPDWGTSITFMNGILSGYSSYLGMDTEKKIAVVVLSSNFNWKDKVGQNLLLRLASARGTNAPALDHAIAPH
jgi:CubicO group peptidase (beta-lactamase class C family)